MNGRAAPGPPFLWAEGAHIPCAAAECGLTPHQHRVSFSLGTPGWTHVATVTQATDLLDTGRVVELSLDHDLGDDDRFGRGIEVIDWLAEQQEVHGRILWPRDGLVVHSANRAGRDAMIRAAEHYAAKAVQVRRSVTPSGKPRLTFSQR